MLENFSVHQIISKIKKREIKIVEVLNFYLDRIKKFNPKLNAIISHIDETKITEEAKLKDENFNSDNDKDDIYGLPIAVKELFDIKNEVTCYGYKELLKNIPKQDSLLVDNYRKNTILIGKTNLSEFAVGCHTTNRVYGATSNVYDHSKSAGGSSGGAAAAVAANLIPFADGTDMMGSCRNPAAFANIYGLRPTPGAIAEDRFEIKNLKDFPLISTTGCFARTPNDMEFLFNYIKGKNVKDKLSFDLEDINIKKLSDLKIGWCIDLNEQYKYEDGIIDLCENILKKLQSNNLNIEDLKTEINSEELWYSWIILRAKFLYENFLLYNLKNLNELPSQAYWEYKKGKSIETNDVLKAIEIRNKYNKCLILTEGVFSMDGDISPQDDISVLKKKYSASFMLDDAHGLGVIGDGTGSNSLFKKNPDIDIYLGTLSKAVGSYGGFICGKKNLINFIINRKEFTAIDILP